MCRASSDMRIKGEDEETLNRKVRKDILRSPFFQSSRLFCVRVWLLLEPPSPGLRALVQELTRQCLKGLCRVLAHSGIRIMQCG